MASKKSLIFNLDPGYFYEVYKQGRPLAPHSKKEDSVSGSYINYASIYKSIGDDYCKFVSFAIKNRKSVYDDLNSTEEQKVSAHFTLANEIYKLPAVYTNSCLALELSLKALIAHKEKLKDINIATAYFKQKYSHDLDALLHDTNHLLHLGQNDIELVHHVNVMYSGAKKFQYPHEYVSVGKSEVPALEELVLICSTIYRKVRAIIGNDEKTKLKIPKN